MNRFDLLEKLLVVLLALARIRLASSVVAALRHAQSRAQFADVEVIPHGLNQCIPLCGSSE